MAELNLNNFTVISFNIKNKEAVSIERMLLSDNRAITVESSPLLGRSSRDEFAFTLDNDSFWVLNERR